MSWPENLKLLNGLWPEASWTPEESALYREMLEPLDQQDLAESIKRVRSRYTSAKPALKWLLDEVGRVKDDRRFGQRLDTGSDPMTGFEDNQIEELRAKIEGLNRDQLVQVADRLRSACGMVLDIEQPVQEWTAFRVAMAAAAIDPGVG